MIKERIANVQSALENSEALLVTSHSNRFYLTGFESSAGKVLVTKENSYFLIDFRYFEKAKSVVDSCAVLLSNRVANEIDELLKKNGVKTVFVETYSTSVDEFANLTKQLSSFEISKDNRFDVLLEDMRSVKSEAELELIKKAQVITDDTFSYIIDRIEPGRSEIDVMLDMEFYMRKLGSQGVSFDFIVVSGKNSSLPHGVPSHKLIEDGDFVTMDFGAVVDGYRSDMTRTVAVGGVSDEQLRVYETVLKSQIEAIKAVKPGMVCKDIDKVARDIINGAGYEGCFGHGLGHSVGIEIHENPCFNTRCETVLKKGTVMTVEPGIYLENKFGVRIEDMVYVTENGCIDITGSDKKLIIL
ncbi:MAG: aminopeptidase P family protein [Clostridia bacterium]|nr:aminopeptidase P family protein [Clostridia bacterium]